MCHHVPENTVLGAIDIQLDVTEYRNKAWMYLLILFGVIAFFTIVIAFNMSHVIEQFVRKPLLTLIQLAKAVFFQTDTKEHENFESKEFREVASQLVQFGKELKERDSRIEQTASKFQSLSSEIDITLKETLFAMGEAEETRSKETRQHTLRVVEYSRLIATISGMEEHEIDLLVTATPLHDIGKIGIPDSILLKVGPLSDEERTIMKTHSQLGHDILKHSEREVLQAAATIALEHHERWDGLGYPKGLKGENIHIFGRIVAIADVFDALGTKRVYKEAWPLGEVKTHFKEERSRSFDPRLVDLFLEHFHKFEVMHTDYYNETQLLDE
jgi:response regulator RpfG family c-di-GMP phosphodiesterase